VHEEEKDWKERFKEVLRKEQELAGLADTLASKMAESEVLCRTMDSLCTSRLLF
jgi:hypothetical protein